MIEDLLFVNVIPYMNPDISLEAVSGCRGKPSRGEKARSFAERQTFRIRTRAIVAAGVK